MFIDERRDRRTSSRGCPLGQPLDDDSKLNIQRRMLFDVFRRALVDVETAGVFIALGVRVSVNDLGIALGRIFCFICTHHKRHWSLRSCRNPTWTVIDFNIREDSADERNVDELTCIINSYGGIRHRESVFGRFCLGTWPEPPAPGRSVAAGAKKSPKTTEKCIGI